MKRRAARICDNCGKPYWRSNSIRAWTVRNEGCRSGWKKVEERICNSCLSPNQALRTASLFGIRIVKATKTA